jgi:UTP-glucose-1-phosphate uridylyltransferase
MQNVTILPAAGQATRMRGLPKFLLPCGNLDESLLERHIRMSLEVSDLVWISTRPQYAPLLTTLGIQSDRVMVSAMETLTMSQTVRNITDFVDSERFTVIMPDTFFGGDSPNSNLAESTAPLHLSLWAIREEQRGKLGQVELSDDGKVISHSDKDPQCRLRFAWGAMSFSKHLASLIDIRDPHVGYLIDSALAGNYEIGASPVAGSYFDCGTPQEYRDLIASSFTA